MKIAKIQAFALKPSREKTSMARSRRSWLDQSEVANPMSAYPRFKSHRKDWLPEWPQVGCLVWADDGTWGFGMTNYGAPTIALINDYLGQRLIGEDASDIEAIWQMMVRLCAPFGASGLASYAISALDLALWDLKGNKEKKPVYALAGTVDDADPITCYATGNDTDWQLELGFSAFKLACPHGPVDGEAGLDKNQQLVAQTREIIGPDKSLMLDCWMAFDLDYTIEISQRLAPYHLGWLEDCLTPEDIISHHKLRERLPQQCFGTGEHWYGVHPFTYAAQHQLADIFQPDICWVGGFTACQKIAAIASAASIDLILHAGINTPFGQHFTHAYKSAAQKFDFQGEFFVGMDPGTKMRPPAIAPAVALPVGGKITPTDAPGFGHGLTLDMLEHLKA